MDRVRIEPSSDQLRKQAHNLLDELLDKAAREQLHGDILAGCTVRDGKPTIPVYEIRGTRK